MTPGAGARALTEGGSEVWPPAVGASALLGSRSAVRAAGQREKGPKECLLPYSPSVLLFLFRCFAWSHLTSFHWATEWPNGDGKAGNTQQNAKGFVWWNCTVSHRLSATPRSLFKIRLYICLPSYICIVCIYIQAHLYSHVYIYICIYNHTYMFHIYLYMYIYISI